MVIIKSGFASFLALIFGLAILSILVLVSLNHTSTQLSSVKQALQGLREANKGQTASLTKETSPLLENPQREINISASFDIYTNGTKRIFTDSKYHNLSGEVYITSQDPGIIYVKKGGITWDDFFKTLPMSLTKNCLVTGTNQTYCTGENGVLRFYINGVENRDALDLVIQSQDSLSVKFE